MTKKSRFGFVIYTVLLGFLFIVLSFLVNQDYFRSLDYSLMVDLQKIIPRGLDNIFSLITLIGSSEIITFFTGLIFVSVLIKFKHLFFGLGLYLLIFVIEITGKLFIYHPKPPGFFNRYSLDFHFPSSFFVDTQFSFPSGHMSRSTFIVMVIIFLLVFIWKKKTVIPKIITTSLLIFFLTVVFVSRIYLGEHWLSDVLGGLLLGSMIAGLSMSFW